MKTLSITATADGTGKTAIALALGRIASERDMNVGYLKPKGTRLETQVGKVVDRDPQLATDLLGLEADTADLVPIVYSSTFVENAVRGRETPDALRERVREAFETIGHGNDLVLVEGAGHHRIGGIVDLTDPEVGELLDADVLLVTTFERLADLDNLLGAVDDFGDRLAGVLFNGVHELAMERLERDAIPFLERRGVSILGVLPHQRELAGVTVGDLAAELGGELLTSREVDAEEPSGRFIERFLVGAMGSDTALRHFRRARNAAVITGGDRADIHTAAIEASGVECLVLTGGQRPPSAILGRAERAGLPVLAVTMDTLATVERAEAIVRSGRTRDAETVYRMQKLLEDHADLDELLDTR